MGGEEEDAPGDMACYGREARDKADREMCVPLEEIRLRFGSSMRRGTPATI
jgi:hypothetical protein